jgi:fused signal recognition particle receptor
VPKLRLFGNRGRTDEGVKRTRETWLGRMASLFRERGVSRETWDELEEALISADVGVAATEAVLRNTQERLEAEGAGAMPERVLGVVKEELLSLLGNGESQVASVLDASDTRPKPLVVLVVGVNGSGKTTSIAKLAQLFQEAGERVVLGAADTFRAAAIEQLGVWAQRLGVEMVAHQSGGDPAAVAYDALEAGKARGVDVVIIDTAGRLHTKSNLMEELKKIRRVLGRLDPTAPHLTLLVMDATTGQNGLAQAQAFIDAVSCDGVFLAKLDGTARGGVVFAIGKELGLPVAFIGTGEGLEDVSPFDPKLFVDSLFTPAAESRV